MLRLGIMQGRLSPPINCKIQSFPAETWRQEFFSAKSIGLKAIEWVVDENWDDHGNPLLHVDGVKEILRTIRETGVLVESVCADFFMNARLVSDDGRINELPLKFLLTLIQHTRAIGASTIVLPFVDDSSLKTLEAVSALTTMLNSISPFMNEVSVRLALETDLPPVLLRTLVAGLPSYVCLNFDTGNRCSQGYDPGDELTPLRNCRLGSVHLKDRKVGGGTVQFGCGSVDFRECLRLINELAFPSPLILQPARIPDMSELDQARSNKEFVEARMP